MCLAMPRNAEMCEGKRGGLIAKTEYAVHPHFSTGIRQFRVDSPSTAWLRLAENSRSSRQHMCSLMTSLYHRPYADIRETC